jgi:hypothetical protein
VRRGGNPSWPTGWNLRAAHPAAVGPGPIPTIRRDMATKQGSYAEASIRVLKGLEPVKQRPGMYTRTDNPLHVVQEVIDNAAD